MVTDRFFEAFAFLALRAFTLFHLIEAVSTDYCRAVSLARHRLKHSLKAENASNLLWRLSIFTNTLLNDLSALLRCHSKFGQQCIVVMLDLRGTALDF
jgi:hypothetical protein